MMRENRLILSVFPGIDLLGRGFEDRGFCVVRGPDPLWGGDIRKFNPPPAIFGGVIGGSPCQDFSKARRDPPTGYGLEMLDEFKRVVFEAEPEWWLLENVPGVPDVTIPGYFVQRFNLNAREVGMRQNRLRKFQFGSKDNLVLIIERTRAPHGPPLPCVVGGSDGLAFRKACSRMGLPDDFDLPPFKRLAKRLAVANGVPPEMSRRIAAAVENASPRYTIPDFCPCGCGRILTGKQKAATPTCRKRLERARKRDRSIADPLSKSHSDVPREETGPTSL